MDISSRILYEDKNVIVYNKPAGELVQSDRSFDLDVVSAMKAYLSQKGEGTDVSVINRLDRPVSGLVLLTKNKNAAARLSKELTGGQICKDYYAVVCGKLPATEGELVDHLLKDGKTNVSKVVNKGTSGAKEAKLSYRVIASKQVELGEVSTISLVRIHLFTGRHHQIRVQMAHAGCPLLGDAKYNTLVVPGRRMNVSLCSSHLEFEGKSFEIVPSGEGFEYFKEELATL